MYKKITVVANYYNCPEDVSLDTLLENMPSPVEEYEETPYWEYPDDYYNGNGNGMMFRRPMKQKKPMKYKNSAESMKAANVFTTMPNENTEIGVRLRFASRDFFERYSDLIREYILSKTNKTGDSERLRLLIGDHVRTINNVVITWYRQENIIAFGGAFLNLSNTIVDIIDAKVANTDTSQLQSKLITDVVNFTTSLNSLQQIPTPFNTWPLDGVKELFTTYINAIIRQIDARAAGDWDGDQIAAKIAANIMTTGLPTGMAGFADVLSKGIIQQSNWRFTL